MGISYFIFLFSSTGLLAAPDPADCAGSLSKSDWDTAKNSVALTYIHDVLAYKWVSSLKQNNKTFALIAGENSTQSPSPAAIASVNETLDYFIKKGRLIIYDADSNMAAHIAQRAGQQAIGITAKMVADNSQVISISNPFLRLRALASAHKVAVTSGSEAGVGLVFYRANYLLGFDGAIPEAWNPASTEQNLGMQLKKPFNWPIVLGRRFQPVKPFASDKEFDQLEAKAKAQLIVNARLMEDSTKKIKNQKPGLVIFGSGAVPEKYEQLIYDIVSSLSQQGSVATGGAGGVMEIANQAAFDAATESIGINLGGRLKTEKESKVEVQTLSISVNDYAQRIPLLLQDKKLVLIAPGGGGTMQELAVTLADLGNHPSQIIVFIGKDYYQKIYDGLLMHLPPGAKKRIFLVNSVSEMLVIAANSSRAL